MTTQPTAAGAASRVDADLVARAYRKVMNKEELTNEERRALKRHETEKEEQLRWKYYQTIPQKHWREMSGRQTKVINEQAARYGIPLGGATVNLPKVVRALHNFLAENAQKLARDDDPLMQGSGSPALERYREERAAMARLDRLTRGFRWRNLPGGRQDAEQPDRRESMGRWLVERRPNSDTPVRAGSDHKTLNFGSFLARSKSCQLGER